MKIWSQRSKHKQVYDCLSSLTAEARLATSVSREERERKTLVWAKVCVYLCVCMFVYITLYWRKKIQTERESKKPRYKEPVWATLGCPSHWTLRGHSEWQWTTVLLFRPTGSRPGTSPLLSSILCAPPAVYIAQPQWATAATSHCRRILLVKAAWITTCVNEMAH